MKYILFCIIIFLILGYIYCASKKESYSTEPSGIEKNMNFNTFPNSDSGFIQELGGPLTIAQNQDMPLVTDDQNPWFWSLDTTQPVYNMQL